MVQLESFLESVYNEIKAEVQVFETDAVKIEEAVKAKIEAFAAEVAAKLHELRTKI